MQISELQTFIAREYATGKQMFLAGIERLVDALMRGSGDAVWAGRFPPYVDGVLFQFEDNRTDYFSGQGVAVVGHEQYVEPIAVEFWFSPNPMTMTMTKATIRFGMLNSTRPGYGSAEARKLAKSVLARAISARPKVQFDWKHEFHLADGARSGSMDQTSN